VGTDLLRAALSATDLHVLEPELLIRLDDGQAMFRRHVMEPRQMLATTLPACDAAAVAAIRARLNVRWIGVRRTWRACAHGTARSASGALVRD